MSFLVLTVEATRSFTLPSIQKIFDASTDDNTHILHQVPPGIDEHAWSNEKTEVCGNLLIVVNDANESIAVYNALVETEAVLCIIFNWEMAERSGNVRYHLKPLPLKTNEPTNHVGFEFEILYEVRNSPYTSELLNAAKKGLLDATPTMVDAPDCLVKEGTAVTLNSPDTYASRTPLTLIAVRDFTLGELNLVLGPRVSWFYEDTMYYNQAVTAGLLKLPSDVGNITINLSDSAMVID